MVFDDEGHVARSSSLIAVVGATGTGKSALSLGIAQLLEARGRQVEIVNADAMQLYEGMNIGTAKLSYDERLGVPHHLLDVLPVTADASVAWYQSSARQIVEDILRRGHVPVLVGGSGLYVSSVLFPYVFPGHDEQIRACLETELEANGIEPLYHRLADLDADAATRIGPHNARRIVRALEVAEMTGSPVSGTRPDAHALWKPTRIIGMSAPRDDLTARLNQRVRLMWEQGLPDEVATLIPRGLEQGTTASRAIGYAQALAFLRGELSRDDAIAMTQQLTRRYARRQVSWFARYPQVTWLTQTDESTIEHTLDML